MKTNNNIESNSNVNENNAEQGKNTSYLKVMLIFCAVMAIVVIGMNYLLKNVF
ncbi:MAG: hypothetical protein LBQ60_04335 [Bacteroidales bacterium]|jgi:hypothetical protein|nr:hypothetical protein [Bacteroidales bacterium]